MTKSSCPQKTRKQSPLKVFHSRALLSSEQVRLQLLNGLSLIDPQDAHTNLCKYRQQICKLQPITIQKANNAESFPQSLIKDLLLFSAHARDGIKSGASGDGVT